ncbi:MAG: DEAD/DEAH box helicase, partial [Planctomycetota bacterium]
MWDAYAAGSSGLVHVPTGAGKTYAAYGGPLAEVFDEALEAGDTLLKGVRIVFVTPLRAVSRDIEKALKAPIKDLGLLDSVVTVESRTGDTSTSVRARQRSRLPSVLITTPESLTLLLTQRDAAQKFASLRCVIIDEWHELLSSKRGTQVELACARLRTLAKGVRTWALSATLANLDAAAQAAVGNAAAASIISADIDRPVVIETVLPDADDPFPWAGHLGLTQMPRVVESIPTDAAGMPTDSTLVFVNTRSQAERWHHAFHATKPLWAPVIALHHGSLDRDERERVEAGLKDGSARVVIATSSLDLGVDFAPVERVMQIGSPKGIARLMQRAGRASHRPGAPCKVVCVPTNALEFIEVAAVRRSIRSGRIEPRSPEKKPLDVLSQHMVSMALGGGFTPGDLFREVRTSAAYESLTREEFDWTLHLVTEGGDTLHAYPEYRKVVPGPDGVHTVNDKRIAMLHRFNVGTITGAATMEIRYLSGKRLGSIEESFVQKLR